MIRSAMIILQKDARLRLRDRSVWMFALVIPLALTFVFSLVFPDQDDFRLVAGVVDLDGGEVAEGFTDGVLPSLVDEGFLTVTNFAGEVEARSAIESGDIAAAWVIPEGFTGQVTEGHAAELRLLANPDRALSAEVARGIADGYVARIERASLAVATGMTATQGQLTDAQVQELSTDAVTSGSSIAIGELVAADRQLDPSSYLAAGMAIFFLFFTVTFGITGFLEEKDQGTLPRLLAAPISPVAIHLGKALGAFVLGVVSMMVLAVASDWLLDAPWGPPVGVAILTVAAVIAALGVMALVGTFARTAEQAGNLQAIVALVLGLTGGVFFPVGSGVLGSLSLLSPHGWFLRGLADLAGERTWTAVLPAAGALVAFGVITAIPGAVRMNRVQRP
jgi:ABC-2 type transport system permease protein